MKKYLYGLLGIFLLLTACKYDDTYLSGRVDNLEQRVSSLEELCYQMNVNISSLQTIINASQQGDYITSITELYENGECVGYTLAFAKGNSINIYHGKDGADGKDGQNGADGKDGQNGADGYTPKIGVKKDSDGYYYWTLDDEWLTDNQGNKIKAEGKDGANGTNGSNGQDGVNGSNGQNGSDGQNGTNGKDGKDGQNGSNGKDGVDGKDGITPQLKIVDGDWYVSSDNGLTWQYLGRATGADGKDGADGKNGRDGLDGDSMFRDIDTSYTDFVIFTLSDGTQIKIPTWYAFEELKNFCNQLNVNIQSLQKIIDAMETGEYIVSCVPLVENGIQIGYTITFSSGESIIIYHGKDGKDGKDGNDGKDGKDGAMGSPGVPGEAGANGTNGADGHTPQIGVKTGGDGKLYWTVDGEFLTDENGNKIPVTGNDGKDGQNGEKGEPGDKGQDGQNGTNGKDGITPQLKIEDGYWWVSYDEGDSWSKLGSATGSDNEGNNGNNGDSGNNGNNGKDGADDNCLFSDVDNSDADYIVFTLTDGTSFKVARYSQLEISFDSDNLALMRPNTTRNIGYTVTSTTNDVTVEVLYSGNVKAKVETLTGKTGNIVVTTGTLIDEEYDKVIVLVSNGQRVIMSSISFEEAGLKVTSDLIYDVEPEGKDIEINLSTNTNYSVSIPEEDREWISHTGTRAWRNETIILKIAENTDNARTSTLSLVDEDGFSFETITINQKAAINAIPDNMELAFPDPIFRAYVLSNFDLDHNNKIDKEEALKVTKIRVVGKSPDLSNDEKIQTLKGIEYFLNLTSLECGNNNISNLNLSNNTLLTKLDCHNNVLTELNVKEFKNLEYLSCFSNNLKELNVTFNTKLTTLYCHDNQITEINLTNNKELRELVCGNNNIEDINLTNNIALSTLNISHNKLSEIDLTHNVNLNLLVCESCNLGNLDISQLDKLGRLVCGNNNIKELDLTNQINLTTLECPNNNLTSLDVSNCNKISGLECENNRIEKLNLSNAENLLRLYCQNNVIKDLELNDCVSLITCHCQNNKVEELDISKTSLGTVTGIRLICSMDSLKKIIMKKGWSTNFISDINKLNIEIEYVN